MGLSLPQHLLALVPLLVPAGHVDLSGRAEALPFAPRERICFRHEA
jgi:hypothetical protein